MNVIFQLVLIYSTVVSYAFADVSYPTDCSSAPSRSSGVDCGALLLSDGAREEEAEVQLSAALVTAKAENKLVFLRFSEVWCTFCTKMQGILDRPNMKSIFGAEFVDLKIDLGKVPKARQLYMKYAKNGDGVPFFAFLDTTGVALANSVGKNGNVGCPTTSEEIAFFSDSLRRTTKMTAGQLSEVEVAFSSP